MGLIHDPTDGINGCVWALVDQWFLIKPDPLTLHPLRSSAGSINDLDLASHQLCFWMSAMFSQKGD